MALSGTVYGTLQGSNGIGWRSLVEWTASQSISGNTSALTLKIYIQTVSSKLIFNSYNSKTYSFKIDSQTVSGTYNININQTSNATAKHLIATKSVTVTHDASGNKSFSISGSINLGAKWNPTNTMINSLPMDAQSQAIDKIPRAALINQLVISNDLATINYTPQVASYYNQIVLCTSDNTTIATINCGSASVTQQTASYEFTSANKDMITSKTSDSMFAVIYAYCKSFTDSNYKSLIGTSSKVSANYALSDEIKPDITSVRITEIATDMPTALTGTYIQGKSKLQFNITAQAKSGATIVGYMVSMQGNTTLSGTSPEIKMVETVNGSGVIPILVTATDSRGFSNTLTTQVTVERYFQPAIREFRAFRSALNNATGEYEEDDTGDYIGYYVSYEVAPLLNKNTFTGTFLFGIKPVHTITQSTHGYANAYTYYVNDSNGQLDDSSTGDGIFKLTDIMNTVTSPKSYIPKVSCLFSTTHDETGMAFGVVATISNAYEFGRPLYMSSDLILNNYTQLKHKTGNNTYETFCERIANLPDNPWIAYKFANGLLIQIRNTAMEITKEQWSQCSGYGGGWYYYDIHDFSPYVVKFNYTPVRFIDIKYNSAATGFVQPINHKPADHDGLTELEAFGVSKFIRPNNSALSGSMYFREAVVGRWK